MAKPILRLEEVPWNAALHMGGFTCRITQAAVKGDRVWLFLDYGPEFEMGRYRWAIHARHEHEDFQLVQIFQNTAERAIDGLHIEIELGKQAIREIRRLETAPRVEGGG